MNKKKWLGILAACMMLVCLWTAAAAEVSGINVMGVWPVEKEPKSIIGVRALDGTGAGVRMQQSDFHFAAGDEKIELIAEPMTGNLGHIVVVDTSLYYYGSKNIKDENIQEIVSAYLSRLPSDDRVMFVLATSADRPTSTKYMSLAEAKDYAKGIALGKESSAQINTAVYEAFKCATQPAQGDPLFNSVFIVADPDLESNDDRDHTLSECAQMRNSSGGTFDVAVAVVYREKFLDDTGDARRKALNNGFEKYQNFAEQCGGKYIRIPQDNQGVDTNDLHLQLNQWLYTIASFKVDFSPVTGHIPTEPQMQNVQTFVSCGNAVRTVSISVDTALLPPPEATPTPTSSVPTPTPAPTPVVHVGQADSMAMQAIYALNQMNYLEKTNYKEFDNTCFIAYIDFCKRNGIDPRDGIYEETYELMLSGKAVAVPKVTPEPTATPMPTIPPEGYSINDQDTEGSGGYIAQVQAVLKSLNCYAEGANANVGRMDQATIDAANKYCAEYNWRNDHANGVSMTICQEILTNGPKLNPIQPPEPTAQEKAMEFLMREMQVAGVTIKMWMPVAACFVLLFLILAIVLLCSGGKKKKEPRFDPTPSPKPTPAPAPTPMGGGMNGAAQSSQIEEDERTADPFFSKFATLHINYGGRNRVEDIELKEGVPFTIGRKACRLLLDSTDKEASRLHAELVYRGGVVYVRDLSSFNNTAVNGVQVHSRAGESGMMINNGDELRVGQHVITIKW